MMLMPRTRLLPRAAAFLVAIAAAIASTRAYGSVSIAMTFDGLMTQSTAAAVVTCVESKAVWENGRIYTYTRVHIDRPVAGSLGSGSSAWVRTLGGIVGSVGQIVEGEPAFAPGEISLLFLRPGPVGSFVVTARGQGQFPVIGDGTGSKSHVVKSNAVGMLLAPRAITTGVPAPRLAAEVMDGRLVDDVAGDIVAGWGAAHAH